MEKINLLDCTLRDGGYINDWRFGKEAIADMTEKLADTHVEVLEIGFLKDEPYQKDRTVFNSMEQVKKLIAPKKPGVQYAVMCEVVNPLPLELLEPRDEDSADIIRVIVWKTKHDSDGNVVDALDEGFAYCKGIVEKGYQLCVQPARVDQYTDEEFVAMVRRFATLNPMAIYVVDSWGTQNPEDLLHYMHLADENMDRSIILGYHGHNNMMQALSAAQAMIKENFDRDIMIDASVYGIGRGAGNLNLEIIAKYLNEHCGKQYSIATMLSIYSDHILDIYNVEHWGYSTPYFLTAKFKCNPNYARIMAEYQADSTEASEVLAALSDTDKVIVSKKAFAKVLYSIRKKTIGLCIAVPIKDRSSIAKTWIEIYADEFAPYGVDLVFYDSSANDDIAQLVKNADKENVLLFRYSDTPVYPDCICEKICSLFSLLHSKYRYIWACRDRSIPLVHNVYSAIVDMVKEDKEALYVYPHAVSSQYYGRKDITKPCELAKSVGELTSLGSTIYSSRIAKELVEKHPVTEDNKGLWIPIELFQIIADREFCIGYIAANSFVYLPYTGSSYWLNNGSSDYLWLVQWPKMVRNLPEVYEPIKEEMFRFENWTLPPFLPFMTLPARASGSYSPFFVLRNLKNFYREGKANCLKVIGVSLVPPAVAKWCIKHDSNLFLKGIRKVCKLFAKTIGRFLVGLYRFLINFFQLCFVSGMKGKYIVRGGQRRDYITEKQEIESYKLSQNSISPSNPWITIVIPTYHRTHLLESTIESLRLQKPVQFEWDVVVVDNDPYDGKKNETQVLIERINWDKLTYYRNAENLRATGNMNRGVCLARGKWVAILHDDDLMNLDYLERIERRIKAAEKASSRKVAMISDTHNIAEQDLTVDNRQKWSDFIQYDRVRAIWDDNILTPVSKYEYILTGGCGVGAPTAGTIYSRECFLEMGGLCEDKSLLDDAAFAYALCLKYSVYRSNYAMGFYRQGDNATKRQADQIVRDLYDIREYAFQSTWQGRIIAYFTRMEHLRRDVEYIRQMTGEDLKIADFRDLQKYRPNPLRSALTTFLANCYVSHQQKMRIDCSDELNA